MQLELFDNSAVPRQSRNQTGKETSVRDVVKAAQLADKFFYSTREARAILHCSRSELYAMLANYRLDATLFRGVIRIPWCDLAAYILTSADDTLAEDYYAYVKTRAA